MRRSSLRRGVSLADIVIVLVVLVFVSGVGIVWAQEQREVSNRVRCASNLRQIGMTLLLYANENRQQYPRTHYSPDLETHPLAAFTVPEAVNPFVTDKQTYEPLAGQKGENGAPAYNDVTAALFLLIRTQDIGPEVFICASTIHERGAFNREGSMRRSNFSSKRNLSYSVATPYPSREAAEKGYRWHADLDPEFVVAADLNPGKRATDITDPAYNPSAERDLLRLGNSPNHNRDGQNVLHGDGHVSFEKTPFAGVHRDNIYTKAANDDRTDTTSSRQFDDKLTPTHVNDSILWPVADEDTFDAEKAAEPLTEQEQADLTRPRIPTRAYYTIDDGQTWFEDDISKVAPFEHEGKTAYRVQLFTCDDGKTVFPTYLERYTPQAKAAAERAQKSSAAGNYDLEAYEQIEAGQEVKKARDPDAKWVSVRDYERSGAIMTPVCPDGTQNNIAPVFP